MKHTSVFVFDVDGVLCDIGQPTNDAVISRIVTLLQDGAYVAINTGRDQHSVHDKVTEPLKNHLSDIKFMDRLMIVCEMGGVMYTFSDGEHTRTNTNFKLAPELIARAQHIFTEGDYDAMCVSAKDSMTTFMIRDGAEQERFEAQQAELVDALHVGFKDEPATVAATLESVDVHASHAGKQAGAQVVYEWLEQVSDVVRDDFICFGDNNNDYEMARWFAEKGCRVRFVYTGIDLHVKTQHDAVEVINTSATHSQGTLEFLDRYLMGEKHDRAQA